MIHIVGIDPGPVVGAVLIRFEPARIVHAEAAQISAGGISSLITGWLESYDIAAMAAERFVITRGTHRMNDRKASQAARDVLAWLRPAEGGRCRYRWIERSAAEVKPWATDTRLGAAGLLDPTKGMRHARDAARHALFAACRDFAMVDPMSKRAGRPA